MTKIVTILSLLLVLAGPGQAAPKPLEDRLVGTSQGVAIREWSYRSDGLKVLGELYLPPGEKQLPLVVFSHDGIGGISKEHRLSSIRLARAGFVVFSPSYRGEDGSEGMVEIAKGEVNDVLNVLPLLKAHPRVDGEKVALAGASHGALISVLAASRNEEVDAVVAAYGVMDIYKWYDYLKRTGRLGKDPVTVRTYGPGPHKRPRSFEIRNALSVVSKLDCPVLLLQGSKDEIVPPEQARFMEQALKKHGKSVSAHFYPDALHGFLVYAPYLDDASQAEKQQTEQAWKTMLSFLRRHLK